MATLEEKEHTLETIKGPRFYHIQLWGYGGESEYMDLTKEQYDFWHAHIDKHGDGDAVNYCVNAEDGQFEFDELKEVPEFAQFLKVVGEDYSTSWYESATGFTHQWGIDYNHANINIEEVDSVDYDAKVIEELVKNEDLNAYIDLWNEATNYELELVDMGVDEGEDAQGDYVGQMNSAEKGTFFDCVIETVGKFDPKKLKIRTLEYLNGDDTVQSIEYDGKELDNNGGDTNGKGYSFHVWSNA